VAVALKVAVLELDERANRTMGGESHLDLAGPRGNTRKARSIGAATSIDSRTDVLAVSVLT
jgi:hypothetical protein